MIADHLFIFSLQFAKYVRGRFAYVRIDLAHALNQVMQGLFRVLALVKF